MALDAREALLPSSERCSAAALDLRRSMAVPHLGHDEFHELEKRHHQKKKQLTHGSTISNPMQCSDHELKGMEVTAREITQRAIMGGHAKMITLHDRHSTIGSLCRAMTSPADAFLSTGDDLVSCASEDAARQTNGEALMNVLNNQLGSGMVNIGYTIGQTGLIGGPVCLLIAMLINRSTVHLVLEANHVAGTDPTTTEIASKTYGRAGHLTLVITYTLVGFLSMVSYIDAGADAIEGLLMLFYQHMGYSMEDMPSFPTICILTWLILDVPLTLIRSLKGIAVISFVAFLGAIVLLTSLAAACAMHIWQEGLPDVDSLHLFPPDLASFLNAFPIMACMFAIQAGSTTILATMVDGSEENTRKVSKYGMGTAYTMFAFIGMVLYSTFGNHVAGDATQCFPPSNPIAVVARFAILDLVVLSYVFMMIPSKFAMIDLVFHKNEALLEASPLQNYGTLMVINLGTITMALLIPNLTLVMGLMGSLITPTAAFIMPPAFMLKAKRHPAQRGLEPVPYLHRSNFYLYALLIFGIVLVVMSSQQLLHRFQTEGR